MQEVIDAECIKVCYSVTVVCYSVTVCYSLLQLTVLQSGKVSIRRLDGIGQSSKQAAAVKMPQFS